MFRSLHVSAALVTSMALVSSLALAPLPSLAESTARRVPDFTVFFDPPTGFVFVKLPEGWKFVGKAEPREGVALAPSMVTSLLEPSGDTDTEADTRVAREP